MKDDNVKKSMNQYEVVIIMPQTVENMLVDKFMRNYSLNIAKAIRNQSTAKHKFVIKCSGFGVQNVRQYNEYTNDYELIEQLVFGFHILANNKLTTQNITNVIQIAIDNCKRVKPRGLQISNYMVHHIVTTTTAEQTERFL